MRIEDKKTIKKHLMHVHLLKPEAVPACAANTFVTRRDKNERLIEVLLQNENTFWLAAITWSSTER